MQKIKNPILCWIVILAVFIRPNPAQAMVPLAVVAVGAVIAATGVMVAGAGVYKPPTFAQANAAVDSVTGDIKRKVVVARAFADGVSTGLRGYAGEYVLDYPKAKQWVKDHALDFPVLYPAAAASDIPQGYTTYPFSTGGIIADPSGGANKRISSLTYDSGWLSQLKSMELAMQAYPNPPYVPVGGDQVIDTSSNPGTVYHRMWQAVDSTHCLFRYFLYSSIDTADAPTIPLPIIDSPSAFAAAYPNTEAGQDETDKIAAQNPAAIKSEPVPFSPEQIEESMKQIEAEILDSAADTAEIMAAADPTNTALQIAAQQARTAADQAAIQAEATKAEVESIPEEEAITDTPPASLSTPTDPPPALDFTPLYALKDQAVNKYPFNILSSLTGYFNCLVAPAKTPELKINNGFGQEITMSMSSWDGTASMLRGFMLLFFNAACMYGIVRRWS